VNRQVRLTVVRTSKREINLSLGKISISVSGNSFSRFGVLTFNLPSLPKVTYLDQREHLNRKLRFQNRHKLPRWVFFANQGEFTTGDYEEIMNKASCLSLVSNAVLYWNTIKINDIVVGLRDQGESVDNETLSHISLLPYKHVLPNGTYFIEDK